MPARRRVEEERIEKRGPRGHIADHRLHLQRQVRFGFERARRAAVGAENQFHTPSPAASRNTRANGSRISGLSLSVSAARDAATPSAVAPTLSVISQLSLSVLATLMPSRFR